MTHLADKICKVASEEEGLSQKDIPHYRAQLDNEWQIKEEKLERKFHLQDLSEALNYTQKITEIVEREGHHPEIHLNYGEARIIFSTKEVAGLHENDFIMAAKIDKLWKQHQSSSN